MKFERKGISTTVIAAIVVVVIVVAGAGAYVATSSGAKTTTTTVVSTATSTTTSVSTSVSTSGAAVEPAGSLTGAGSTFVNPLMSVWTFGYTQVQPNIQVNYASVGSGAGIAQITAGTVNFGASDAPLTAAQYTALPSGSTLLTIPEAVGSEVPAYNLPGVTTSLKFTGNVLAEIFLGNITTWNDPAIAALNPGVTLPTNPITVVHRSDGSGTTYVWTQFLSDANAQWAKQVGFATTVNWPTGLGGKGNEGVAGVIENTQYSIGYLELAYVLSNPTLITAGTVRNAAGNFMNANATTVQAAITAGAGNLPAGNAQWTTVSIVNAIYNDTAATNAYPIVSFTYLLVYQQQTNQANAVALANFIWWIVNHAQGAGAKIGYVSIPSNAVTLDDATLNSITYNGTPLHPGP